MPTNNGTPVPSRQQTARSFGSSRSALASPPCCPLTRMVWWWIVRNCSSGCWRVKGAKINVHEVLKYHVQQSVLPPCAFTDDREQTVQNQSLARTHHDVFTRLGKSGRLVPA